MAGRHIRDMIVAYGERDDLKFRRAAQAIIKEEETKRHTVLARELKMQLAASSSVGVHDNVSMPELPVDRDSSLPLARVHTEELYLSDLVLKKDVEESLRTLINEVRHWHDLDAAGLPRRNRLLLSGPPGCGKTTAVTALAHELNRPLVTARVEGLMSSYLGETATNLSSLFSFASTGPYVLFLDEFDSLGKMRDDPSDHGELRRVVNTVLQLIDAFAGPSLIVAATNHSAVLDAALWRRFDSVVELGLPSGNESGEIVKRILGAESYLLAQPFVNQLEGLPHAAAEYFANSARRHAILRSAPSPQERDMMSAINETVSRPWH